MRGEYIYVCLSVCIYLRLICIVVGQKPTQNCKAIILQLKIRKKKKKSHNLNKSCSKLKILTYYPLVETTGEGSGTRSRTLAWKYPRTEEPGGLQSTGSLSWTQLSDFTFTFHFHALAKEMAIHSSVLAWRIPGMGDPGGLPSMGSHRVGHD